MNERPNILLVTTDQQRFDTIHALGNTAIFTPHLDWLVDQGITYSRCYTDCPICMPARATIMTGRYGFSNNLTGNTGSVTPMAEHPTLAGILTNGGYQTRAQGKMHFHPLRANYGFEHMEILPDYYRYMAKHPHLGRPMNHGVGQNEMEPVFSTVDESASLTRWTVERSIDFLETRDESRPFFLWTSFAKPHPPFDCNEKYWHLYDGIDIPEPKYGDWSQRFDSIPAKYREPTLQLNRVHRFSEQQLHNTRRAYYACISQVDYNLGMLFARMREMDLFKNTWIIFTSDHGEMLGDHHLGAKSVFYEPSAHVPLLMRPPGEWDTDRRRGRMVNSLVCLADVLPTCLSIAGAEVPDGASIDGIDILGESDTNKHERLFGSCMDMHCIIEGQYKYLFAPEGGAEQLFDLVSDPYEQHELIAGGSHKEVADWMRDCMVDHLKKQEHPAVHDEKLVSTGPAPSQREVLTRLLWPGFHSPNVPTDVIH